MPPQDRRKCSYGKYERGRNMSYGIVRIQKMTAGAVKGIEIHDRREKEGISHTNKDIDWTRTHENYDLHPDQNQNFNRAIKERISQLNLKRAVRKDAIVMVQCLVTSDRSFFENLSEDETKQFFQKSYEFLCQKYGNENVISATVHMDEKTPHMHFNFVPVTDDGRLSAKSIFRYRSDLGKLHDDFYASIGKSYGLERGEQSDGEFKKHLDTEKFKKQTLNQEITKLTEQKKQLKSELKNLIGNIKHVKSVDSIKIKKSLIGDNVTMSAVDYENLLKHAKFAPIANDRWKIAEEKNKNLESKLKSFIEYKLETNKTISDLQNQNSKLGHIFEETKQRLYEFSDEIDDTLNQISPSAKKEFLDTYKKLTLPEPEKIHPTKDFYMPER